MQEQDGPTALFGCTQIRHFQTALPQRTNRMNLLDDNTSAPHATLPENGPASDKTSELSIESDYTLVVSALRRLTVGILSSRPLAIDLYCGLGGWAEGFLSEGYRVIGFDIEAHDYGTGGYPGELVIQDVRTLHGSQFKDAAVIVASPPCQAYSYRAMPWKRAKALPPPDNTLFNECFRIQHEACEAAGRYIPLIVENVRGAQKWVGPAKWHFGSFYIWGDVPALMPITFAGKKVASGIPLSKVGFNVQAVRQLFHGDASLSMEQGRKQTMGGSWYGDHEAHKQRAQEHIKQGGDWFGRDCETSMSRMYSSKSPKRRAASAAIAKIPFPLAQHIARVFKPEVQP